MTEEVIGDAMIWLGLLSAFLLILSIGGIVADYVLPRIGPIRRWLDSLPEFEDDDEEDY